jgi:hypothetical protein
MVALFILPFAAEAQFKPPMPRPSPQAQAQPAPAPVQAEPREIVVPAPQVTVQAPEKSDFFNWIFTAIGTALTGILGFQVFRGEGRGLARLTPEARAAIDQAALTGIQSGVPGQALQAAAGLIPGLAGIAAIVEPMARRAAAEMVAQRLATNQALSGSASGQTPQSPIVVEANPILDRIQGLEALIKQVLNK